MENHHAINGKIHYKWPFFNSYVSLPEGKKNHPRSKKLCRFVQWQGAPSVFKSSQNQIDQELFEWLSTFLVNTWATWVCLTIFAVNPQFHRTLIIFLYFHSYLSGSIFRLEDLIVHQLVLCSHWIIAILPFDHPMIVSKGYPVRPVFRWFVLQNMKLLDHSFVNFSTPGAGFWVPRCFFFPPFCLFSNAPHRTIGTMV